MKSEYINPFIKGYKTVMESFLKEEVVREGVGLFKKDSKLSGVIISVGVLGELSGNCHLTFSKDTAMKYASTAMMGMEVTELGEMSKSALSEMGNMIMGNVCTLLFEQEKKVDITPPTLAIGEQIEIYDDKGGWLCISFSGSMGDSKLIINIED